MLGNKEIEYFCGKVIENLKKHEDYFDIHHVISYSFLIPIDEFYDFYFFHHPLHNIEIKNTVIRIKEKGKLFDYDYSIPESLWPQELKDIISFYLSVEDL